MLKTALARSLAGTISVISYGDSPAAFYKDNHLPWAAIGAVGAMSVPFVLIAGITIRNKRFRYSDEADITEPGRPPLLGILPVIPKKITDPEQVSIVAHCVHQIRVTLQIANSTGKRCAYMVTSGTPGDGKTSLIVALGMSFASSGSRTLLIDGDMVGRALSHRLAGPTPRGMPSPMIIGALNKSVQRTTVPNLFLLPLPDDAANEPGDISPPAVRNLLKQARSLFDVVLVDTGPALGSIEASIMANAVDGVIIAISRGQERALVNRAIRHLRASGANILGLVFNRAEKRDFQRSVASKSVRSSPRADGLALPNSKSDMERLGPLAVCVTSSTRPLEVGD
jgi:capsular exopolysaccharide synthesis family protein